MLGGLVTSQEQVDKIRETPGSAEELRAAGMKIVGSGPPLGAAGRPVGSEGMFGTFTKPMTR